VCGWGITTTGQPVKQPTRTYSYTGGGACLKRRDNINMKDSHMTSCPRQYVVAGFASHASLPRLPRTRLRECAFCDVRRSVASTVCKVSIERPPNGPVGPKPTRSCASAAELPSAASTESTTARHQYHVELLSSISDVDSDAWNALARTCVQF
jgi:hypothetical protein